MKKITFKTRCRRSKSSLEQQQAVRPGVGVERRRHLEHQERRHRGTRRPSVLGQAKGHRADDRLRQRPALLSPAQGAQEAPELRLERRRLLQRRRRPAALRPARQEEARRPHDGRGAVPRRERPAAPDRAGAGGRAAAQDEAAGAEDEEAGQAHKAGRADRQEEEGRRRESRRSGQGHRARAVQEKE